jgi:beta-glucosidase-like glycosyl hydrolase/murein DD-endopeptidase MepM/ murein hydrolase activator NlpD
MGRIEIAKKFGGVDNIPVVRIDGNDVPLLDHFASYRAAAIAVTPTEPTTLLQRIRQTPFKSAVDTVVLISQVLNPLADIATNFRLADNLIPPTAIERNIRDFVSPPGANLRGYLPGQQVAPDTVRPGTSAAPAATPSTSVTSATPSGGTTISQYRAMTGKQLAGFERTQLLKVADDMRAKGHDVTVIEVDGPLYVNSRSYEKPVSAFTGATAHYSMNNTPAIQLAQQGLKKQYRPEWDATANFGYNAILDNAKCAAGKCEFVLLVPKESSETPVRINHIAAKPGSRISGAPNPSDVGSWNNLGFAVNVRGASELTESTKKATTDFFGSFQEKFGVSYDNIGSHASGIHEGNQIGVNFKQPGEGVVLARLARSQKIVPSQTLVSAPTPPPAAPVAKPAPTAPAKALAPSATPTVTQTAPPASPPAQALTQTSNLGDAIAAATRGDIDTPALDARAKERIKAEGDTVEIKVGRTLGFEWRAQSLESMKRLVDQDQSTFVLFPRNSSQTLMDKDADILALAQYIRSKGRTPIFLVDGELNRVVGSNRTGLNLPDPRTINTEAAARTFGRQMAQWLNDRDIKINLGAIIDSGTVPWLQSRISKNPIITTAFYDELQKAGIITIGKHLPNHGFTGDTHTALRTIVVSGGPQAVPPGFQEFVDAMVGGIGGMMPSHIVIRGGKYDTAGKPLSLRREVLRKMLDDAGYKGLTVSDALNMPVPSGVDIIFEAMRANNIAIMPSNFAAARAHAIELYTGNPAFEEIVDQNNLSVMRMLLASEGFVDNSVRISADAAIPDNTSRLACAGVSCIADAGERTAQALGDFFQVTQSQAAVVGGRETFKVTYYAPCSNTFCKMNGGSNAARKGADGTNAVKTLDDRRRWVETGGKEGSPYVTGAADLKRYQGHTYVVPEITYRSIIDGKTYTLKNVPIYIHDTGGAFVGRKGKIDIAGGRSLSDAHAAQWARGQDFLKESYQTFTRVRDVAAANALTPGTRIAAVPAASPTVTGAVPTATTASGIRAHRVDMSLYSTDANTRSVVGALRRAANPLPGHQDLTPVFVAVRKDGSIVSADEVITGANLKEYNIRLPKFELDTSGRSITAKLDGDTIPAEVFFSPGGKLSSAAKEVKRLKVLRISDDETTAVAADHFGESRYAIGDHARLEGSGTNRELVIYDDPNTFKGISHSNWRAYNDNLGAVLLGQRSIPDISDNATAVKIAGDTNLEVDRNLLSGPSEWYRISNPLNSDGSLGKVFDVRFDYYKSGEIAQANRYRLANIKDGTFPKGTLLKNGDYTVIGNSGSPETASGLYFVTPNGRVIVPIETTVTRDPGNIVLPHTGKMINRTPEFGYARGRLHGGIDSYCEGFVYCPVVSPEDGIITFSAYRGKAGILHQIQSIRDPSIRYEYLHSGPLADGLRVGSRVSKGQEISYVAGTGTKFEEYARRNFGGDLRAAVAELNKIVNGKTGWRRFDVTEPHLHFQVKVNGTRVDPALHFKAMRKGNNYIAGSSPDGTILGGQVRTVKLVDATTGEEIVSAQKISTFSTKSESPFFVSYGTKAIVVPGTASPGATPSTPPIRQPGDPTPRDTFGLIFRPRKIGDPAEFDSFFDNPPDGFRVDTDSKADGSGRYFVSSNDGKQIAFEELPDPPPGYRWANRADESVPAAPTRQQKDAGWVAVPDQTLTKEGPLDRLTKYIVGGVVPAGLALSLFGDEDVPEDIEEKKRRDSISYEIDGTDVTEGETKPLEAKDRLGVPEAVPDKDDPTRLRTKVPGDVPVPDEKTPPDLRGPGATPRPSDPLKDLLSKLGGGGMPMPGGGGGMPMPMPMPATPPLAPEKATSTPQAIRLACADSVALVEGHGTTTVRWACTSGSTSRGVGFETKGTASGQITFAITETSTTTDKYKAGIECIQGGNIIGKRNCEIEIVRPILSLIANPSRIKPGDTSQIIWSSVGVVNSLSACIVYSSNGAITKGGPSGTVDTLALTRNTEFAVACEVKGGEPVTSKLVVDVIGDSGSPDRALLPKKTSTSTGLPKVEPLELPFDDAEIVKPTGVQSEEPKSDSFTATDAAGNEVQLCDPNIGITRFTWCLLNNR